MQNTRRIHQSRQRRVYRNIGFFFLLLGILLFVGSMLFYTLFRLGVIFKEPLYIPPIPDSGTATSFNLTDQLQRQLKNSNIEFKSVTPIGDYYKVELSGGETVLFSQKKDISMQIASLQLILEQLTIEGKGFKELDFRFDKPVVNFR